MKPENVNPANFKLERVLFNNGHFSIAFGKWKNGKETLGMRWNGSDTELGYPKVFGNPMWFIIDEQLHMPILQCLFGLPDTNIENIVKALENLT